ncbi:hypothetical protein M0R04_15295 [Candidatus Dojkabacteria bacterium]|jgi:hypothetical protein|nr:hypothetical protein [Candidatus Dojkabacteria bacterium]
MVVNFWLVLLSVLWLSTGMVHAAKTSTDKDTFSKVEHFVYTAASMLFAMLWLLRAFGIKW